MQREQTFSKNGKQALQESDRSLKSTFENAAVGIAHIGLDGSFLRANSRYCGLTGYSLEELKKKTVQDLTPPEEWTMELRLNEKLCRGEKGNLQTIPPGNTRSICNYQTGNIPMQGFLSCPCERSGIYCAHERRQIS